MNLEQDSVRGGKLGQVNVKDGLQDDRILVILLMGHLDLGRRVQHSSHSPHAWKNIVIFVSVRSSRSCNPFLNVQHIAFSSTNRLKFTLSRSLPNSILKALF